MPNHEDTTLLEPAAGKAPGPPSGALEVDPWIVRRRVRVGWLPGHHAGALLLLLGALLSPASLTAQETIVPLQLSFSDPGARSMGFGGAFVALADDATAALANPAGLVQLVKPEVSLEGRRSSYSTPFTERGRVEGLPSGLGADTTVGLRTARSDNTLTGLSFVSLAYPTGRWSLALFRHQLADFEFSSETHGLFGGGTSSGQERFFDQRVTTDLELASHGISAATHLSRRLDIGFGVIYHEASIDARATMFLPDDDPEAGLLAPTSYRPERSLLSQRLFGQDGNWGLIGGFLWSLTDSWRLGGVYRQGPELGFTVELRAGEAYEPPATDTPAPETPVQPGDLLQRFTAPTIELPAVLGLGLAYRAPEGRLTVSFQWDRIDYSSIAESLGDPEQAVDDADELHLGGEYVFLDSTPIVAVRLGMWWDPDHQLREIGDNPFLRALQPPGEDQTHITLGLGLALESFQVDLGVDLADTVDAVSLSAIYSF